MSTDQGSSGLFGRKLVPFALSPYFSDIDLSTKEGRKDYEATTEKLSVIFNESNTHEWLTVFKDRVEERALGPAFKINVDGKPIDLLLQPGLVTMIKLQSYCETLRGDSKFYLEQLAQQMIGILIVNGLSRKSVIGIFPPGTASAD